MDLLSRLIAGSAATSITKQKLNTPAERLSACKRLCGALQQTWRNGTRLSNDSNASGHVANLLNRLNTILHEESRKAAPHSCLLHIVSAQVYNIVAKLALSSDDPDVVNAARQFFHLLINGEVEGVLDSKIFARSLVDLVRGSTQPATKVVDEKGQANLVELLFEIATKIRLDADILPAWFYPERDQSRGRTQGADTQRSQFPLFYVLVEYVHHDAPTGDFARTGLLYLTDMASRSKPLERWMIESDLAPQMASGLMALYSRLGRQAHVLTTSEKALPIIAFSDVTAIDLDFDESLEETQDSMKAFLSYLMFWQDTLNHCKSDEVKDTLLDHFQVLFVQQLLYPSLLESSDVVGGSTSAVMLHLYRILEALDHYALAGRMLRYLLAASEQKATGSPTKHQRGRVSFSRRKSMEQLDSRARQANTPSPGLFNLLDLLTISLHSQRTQTVNASLKLVAIIVQRHHQHVRTHLFRLQPLADANVLQTVSDFDHTMFKLFDIAGSIANTDTIDESYQATLSDSQLLLQRHSCMLSKDETQIHAEQLFHQQAIVADCKLFEALLDLLGSFFANDTITNIVLTETFVALASCEHVSLKEWVVNKSTDSAGINCPALMVVFETLAEQVKEFKSKLGEWDALFTYHRARLSSNGNVPDQYNMRSLSPASEYSGVQRNNSPQPKQRPATPTRTSTNRGRRGAPSSFASIDGTLAISPGLPPTSPNIKAISGSPLHRTSFQGDDLAETSNVTSVATAPSNASLSLLHQQIDLTSKSSAEKVPAALPPQLGRLKLDETASGSNTSRLSDLGSGSITPSEDIVRKVASLNHVLTNAVILQEFVLEIAAMLQIRATLFDEIDLM